MLSKKNKIETLQILRAIAFLEIFLGHCGIQFFTGAFGVSIFIVLSGFCMAINYLAKMDSLQVSLSANVKYAFSKIKKMYGLHLFMLACAFLLARMPVSANALRRLLMDVLLIQSWSPYAEDYFSYNGVAWYLSTYLFISIVAPYAVKFLWKMQQKLQVLLTMVITFAGMIAVGIFVTYKQIPIGNDFAFWLTYISPVYRVAEFFLGAALGWFYLNRRKVNTVNVMLGTIAEIITVAAFIGVICVFHKIEGVYNSLCYTALFTPVSMLLVIVFSCSKGYIIKVLNNRFMLWLGNLSAYTFLIHQVVIRWLVTLLSQESLGSVYTFVLTILSFAITIAGAELVVIIMKKSGGLKWKTNIRNM
ncbi:MAG: acyltransferase [Lachnospiraceae bacterium]|nr:acyltransferase [Lachnospiraceae bacterium]